MSLLANLNRTSPPERLVRPDSTLTAPYNVANPLSLPRTYNHDNATHPSVHDFGKDPANWFGVEPHRYWMAYTPYPPEHHENPCILCSHDGIQWKAPVGLTNPIYPWQEAGWNADTELVWDTDTGRLGCLWIGAHELDAQRVPVEGAYIWVKWSKDGTNWGPAEYVLPPVIGPKINNHLSPTVARGPDGMWRMWAQKEGSRTAMCMAPTLTGPWSFIYPATLTGLTDSAWHLSVIRHSDQYRMLMNAGRKLFPGVSEDGLTWRFGPAVLTGVGEGEKDGLYRSTFQPDDNGVDYRVWYSSVGAEWRIKHTRIPMRHWDVL